MIACRCLVVTTCTPCGGLRIGLILGLLAVASPHAAAPADLAERLMPRIEAHRGKVTVAVKHLETGESFGYHENDPMPTASMIKFPIMVEAYRQSAEQQLDLNESITLRDADKVPGSGILTPHFSAGAQFALRDAIRLMIAYSDNTATNLVIDRIGLPATARTMEKLGLPNTKLHSKVFRRDTSVFPSRSVRFGLGSTTARETLQLYERLHAGELVSTDASREMLEHLRQCQDEGKLARLLPAGTKLAHKGGSVSKARCDAGLMETPGGTIAICVMTSDNEDQSWRTENTANRLCGEIARAVYDHFNRPNGKDVPSDVAEAPLLRTGASGGLVEALQRTLNARLDPSPQLGVDGDFGAMTQAAVIRFQHAHHLVANGEVGSETWRALGTLITEGPPVPDPQAVNRQRLPRSPADRLAGPPIVTCKAWIVGDAKTGDRLWGTDDDRPLDFASTTKIMTAYVVLRSAEQDAAVLGEEVIFSQRADQTPGSTAGVKTGEKLPVRELLYGLLLPSGNDASVALAEHFGARFAPPETTPGEKDLLVRFVAEMNRTAQRLDMQETHYANTHGLPAVGHLASCRDLLKLTVAALKTPRFREYVDTRQRGCRVAGPNGTRRNLLWKNTNRLLAIDGYDGVKTGTTNAAGSCLVSCGRRDDDELVVIVLGATSSDARYVDTRNLYRWAWRERNHVDPKE
ncbi:MAG: serine hydrolase [Pirellulales bacterium]